MECSVGGGTGVFDAAVDFLPSFSATLALNSVDVRLDGTSRARDVCELDSSSDASDTLGCICETAA